MNRLILAMDRRVLDNYGIPKDISILTYQQRECIYAHTFICDEEPHNKEYFGMGIGTWESVAENIDVKPDTLAYLKRVFLEEVKRDLDIDLSKEPLKVIGLVCTE